MLLCLLLSACGDQRPCTSCPDITGAYLVSWQRGFPAEGCPATGPQPVNLTLSQMGNRVSSLVDGFELRGTLFDTFDFSLSGGLEGTEYSLRGRAIIDGVRADGGTTSASRVRVVGSLTTTRAQCVLTEQYTADRL
ncbi:MAG: hypothetical protein MUC96_21085 [Myxococcaceae bacterium]|nr:hypothetical protein [Myxococcaceae bacterium]